jgi:hypothetical protein
MRISAVIALLAAGLAPAAALTLSPRDGQSLIIADDDLKIPGKSPLELCPKGHDDDIVHIENVDLEPNPPQAYVVSICFRSLSELT